MATKPPSASPATGTKNQTPSGATPTTPPVDPNAAKNATALKPAEGAAVVDPNAPPQPTPPPQPAPPPVFRPWLRKTRPPWEGPPKPPPPQPQWKVFHPAMLRKHKLPPQVEFQDALWTRTMLDITMKKKYPKSVKILVGPVQVTHEMHEGPVQVFLEPLAKEMPNYPECQKAQFSPNKPF